jgi:diacylglycerol kinase (ATP)
MRVLILVNPQAGNRKGAEWLTALKDLAGRLGPGGQWRVEPTSKAGLPEQISQMAPGMDSLIIVGGDGTVSQVLQAAWAQGLSMPVGIVPLGTGNDMARSLGLYKGRSWHPEEILEYVGTSKTKLVDLWGLQGKVCFSNYASIGLDAAVVRRFCRLRQWMEERPVLGRRGFYFLLYILVWISRVGQRVPEGTVLAWEDERGGKHEKRIGGARVLALTNSPYYAAGALMEPGAQLDDGLLEVTLFRHMRHYAELMATRAKPLARLGLQERWWRVKARRVEIGLGRQTPVQADGEDLTGRLGSQLTLGVERKAQVRILVR